ncbi:ribosomal L1 domain-containing protein 1 [Eucyclogobius newberryi]|uniref:ribosomal L1 domain-containing protein 1 n=1 Tax=Eucyclogobius newberryi TaxID=166745 RepID=UPI003B5A883C
MAVNMENKEVVLDRAQVKKAVQALQAFLKTKSTGASLLLEETQQISLLFTLWKIPNKAQTIRIPLPHGQRADTDEVCLFTRDEPNMTPDQTQRFYKKLLEQRGVKCVSEVIPFQTLKKEYKPFEAKRRLLGNFDLFLSDDRVRRLLPSHIGKHFYERKKEPLCVDLQSKHLARDIQRLVQGTTLKVTNKGSCCMARVAHSGMTADEVTDNIETTVQTITAKMQMKGPLIKVIHLKSQDSVALPIYTSDLSHLTLLEDMKRKPKKQKVVKNKQTAAEELKDEEIKAEPQEDIKEEEDEEEIPQLVPIETPTKKPKLEKTLKKKTLERAPKPRAAQKKKVPVKLGKKSDAKMKRKVPKVK